MFNLCKPVQQEINRPNQPDQRSTNETKDQQTKQKIDQPNKRSTDQTNQTSKANKKYSPTNWHSGPFVRLRFGEGLK